MSALKIKKVFLILLILQLFCNLNVNAFELKSANADKIMKETLGNSIIEAEFPSAKKVEPEESDKSKKDKELIIQGGVEETVDITLANCIRLALGNNPRIKIAMQDVIAANARIAQVWANYFPKLSWETSASKIRQLELEDAFDEILVYNYYLLGSITLSQMLYDFGVTQNQVTIKKLNYEQYKTTLTETINDVIYNTKKAYYNLMFAYDKQRVAQENVERYQKFYNQAKAFYEIGLNPKIDVTIAEVNLSSAKLKMIQAENNLDLAKVLLNKSMGLPFTNKYNIHERLGYKRVDITLEDSIEIAKQSRPDFKLADLKVEEANQVVKLSKKSYYPVLDARAHYGRGGGGWNANFGYDYGIFLNFNSINILLNKKKIEESKSLYQRELAAAIKTKGDIMLEIQTAYLKLDEKRNQLPVSFLQIKQAKENYELSFGRYKVGVGNAVELKDAQNLYQESLLTYYENLFDYNCAKAELEKSIGKNIVGTEENNS